MHRLCAAQIRIQIHLNAGDQVQPGIVEVAKQADGGAGTDALVNVLRGADALLHHVHRLPIQRVLQPVGDEAEGGL